MEDISSALDEEFRHSALKLEFDSILSIIAAHSNSERTDERLFSGGMLFSIDQIEKSQKEIDELVRLWQNGGNLSLSGWKDSGKSLKKIRSPGSIAASEDLVAIASAERKAVEIEKSIRAKAGDLPLISSLLDRFRTYPLIVNEISRAIDDNGEILDQASRELGRVRKQIGSQRSRLRKEFSDFAAQRGSGKGYEFVTVRGDRYLVSMPRGDASQVKGIVHQTSGSGASLYIEPIEFVESNNHLESLIEEEKREISRILSRLTSEVFEARDDLIENQEALLDLDGICSKALFSIDYRCVSPIHSTDGRLFLRKARHPLLEKKLSSDGAGKITGLDIECPPGLDVLVISGPNAGGKTVALKTVGLITMLDRYGLPVPCDKDPILPDHKRIFVDIGDDQSIERSLSTFSSRIARMKSILALADRESLVLIDEIGDGTDPEEGASIACALLEELSVLCGRTIVTTHLSALKGWAHEKDSAENATLEFDHERLRPLFRMRMGIPGRSWGIEMAGRMGLPSRIVEDAKNRLEGSSLRLEELLGHLEKTERLLIMEREELLRKEEEITLLISSYRDHIDSFEKERDEMERSARKEALDIVSSTRAEMEKLVREIRITQAERNVILRSKDIIRKRSIEFEKKVKKDERKKGLRSDRLEPGMVVMVETLAREGKILECRDQSRVIVELEGGLRVETRVEDLSEAEKKEVQPAKRSVSWRIDPFDPVSTELMIRGMERVEALEEVDAFLDRAVLQGLDTVRIIHGIGRGILKKAVYDMLRSDPRVKEVGPGEPALGGDGVAVVRIR
ncbi:MAG: Smr/MutS family protein [Candidatus Krumholzibacteriota bacterium]|nr:Smr/MutS family protein [Candidatus Krumholzibacteriota bacterium]